jgi:cytoskeletal protein CcmA (bactofilin family)
MAQQIINYGSYPDDANADQIRIAFQKTDNNFLQLFGNLANLTSAVTGVNAGTGITTDVTTGNVTVSANFSALTVHSNSLLVSGLGGFVPSGGTLNSDYTVNAATNTLFIELNNSANTTTANITATGNLTVGLNASIGGNLTVTDDIISSGLYIGNVQSQSVNTVQYADASGNITGDTNFTYVPGNLTLNSGNISAVSFIAGYQVTATEILASSQTIYGLSALTEAVVAENITVNGNASIVGNIIGTGYITGSNATIIGDVVADSFIGNGAQLTNIDASAVTSGTLGNLFLSGNYTINISGGATTAVTVTSNAQPNINSLGALDSLSVIGNITANNATISNVLTGNSATFSGNVSVNGLSAISNISASNASITGNISASNITVTNSVTANSLVLSYDIAAANAVLTGNLASNNISVVNNLSALNTTFSTIVASTSLSVPSITGGTMLLTGNANAAAVNVNQAVVVGNVLAGNLYANSGQVRAQSAAITGSISATSTVLSGNLTVANINASGNVSANNMTVTETIATDYLISNIAVSANLVTANVSNATAMTANTILVTTLSAQMIQFVPLPFDPDPSPGLMHFNGPAQQLRIYNGSLLQWQNLN